MVAQQAGITSTVSIAIYDDVQARGIRRRTDALALRPLALVLFAVHALRRSRARCRSQSAPHDR